MLLKCRHMYNPGSGAKYCRSCLLKLENDNLLACETCATHKSWSPRADVPTRANHSSPSQIDAIQLRIYYSYDFI